MNQFLFQIQHQACGIRNTNYGWSHLTLMPQCQCHVPPKMIKTKFGWIHCSPPFIWWDYSIINKKWVFRSKQIGYLWENRSRLGPLEMGTWVHNHATSSRALQFTTFKQTKSTNIQFQHNRHTRPKHPIKIKGHPTPKALPGGRVLALRMQKKCI